MSRSSPPWWLLAAMLAGLPACKNPDAAARQEKLRSAAQKLAEGQAHLTAGRHEQAVAAFRQSASAVPTDPTPHLLTAEAQRQAGNDGAAILALKHATELTNTADPALKKQLAEMYRQAGYRKEAISVLSSLAQTGELTDPEILTLSRLRAHDGDIDGAFSTLELIQRRNPDDSFAKVLEAEILLLKGEEHLAANLMDRLVRELGLADAWLLRARYFLNNGHAEAAHSDLSQIKGPDAERPEAVRLQARVLNALGRHEEAEAALRLLLEKSPRDEELLSQLADCLLYQGRPGDAAKLLEEALTRRPRYPQALFVRGRIHEAQGDLQRAAQSYQQAIRSDPGFSPALSRIWRLSLHRGERAEAMEALERLFFLGEASLEEKVALAELYAQLKMNLERGRRLVEEAIGREPENPRYRELRQELLRASSRRSPAHKGPIIIRGGR